MKREQRQYWVALTEQEGTILCNYCCYADWYNWPGHETDTSYWEIRCTHRLDAVADNAIVDGIVAGQDCWGFRPKKTTSSGGSNEQGT